MKQVLLQIGKHSSIYMISQIVTNSLSVLMLPLYLQYFSPGEFGGVALIDLTIMLICASLANGLIGATSRFHFKEQTEEGQQAVWWTGFALVTGMMSLGCGALLLSAEFFAGELLGPELPAGPLWLRLAAFSTWMESQNMFIFAYLRTEKRSLTIIRQTITRAFIFVACAAPGIIVWKLGPTATFLSNLVASAVILLSQYAIIARAWGRPRFSWTLAAGLWRYGWPMLVIGVLLIVMQSLNRWFVRNWLSVSEVGLLSLGIQVAEKVNRLIVMPFQQIWSTLVFELHKEHPENAIRTYCFIFEVFCYVLISVFFGCSVAAGPALQIIARPEYLPSVALIPILCLAQLAFAVNDHFLAPLRLSMQTYRMLPSAVTGIVMACVMNASLIPALGVFGAAWATVATYSVYSLMNLMMARQVAVYPYPFARISCVLAGICGTFVAWQRLSDRLNSQWLSLLSGLTCWLGGTCVMAAISYRRYQLATSALDADGSREFPVDDVEGFPN